MRRTTPLTKAKGTRSARMPVEWSRGKSAGWDRWRAKREERKAAAAALAAARDEVQQPAHEQVEKKRQTASSEG